MFEAIEKVEKLPLVGIKAFLIQYDERQVIMDLLQPEAYKIASAEEEWLPPSLHKRLLEVQDDIETQERREARAAEQEEREREWGKVRPERISKTPKTKTRPERGTGMGMGMGMGGGSSGVEDTFGGALSRRSSTRRSRSDRERSARKVRVEYESDRERPARSREVSKPILAGDAHDVYAEFEEISITEKSDFAKMREPLVFWAHDDTVEPEKNYRYRIRLGVFNPIAGTNQFSEQDKRFKNNVILWSEFSYAPETVKIPGMLYFFPYEIQEAAKTVTVTICRYMLGYWYSKDFTVKQGEVIGKVVEPETVEEEDEVTVPATINYATGAVLVDVIPVNDWSGGKNLRARHYFDMLYSFDGTNIEYMPIQTRYWTKELQAKFNELKKSEKEPKKPLRVWGSRLGRRRRGPKPAAEGEERMGMGRGMMRGMSN